MDAPESIALWVCLPLDPPKVQLSCGVCGDDRMRFERRQIGRLLKSDRLGWERRRPRLLTEVLKLYFDHCSLRVRLRKSD